MNWIFSIVITLATVLSAHSAEATAPASSMNQVQAGRVAHLVGEVLQRLHFRQKPLNDEISATFLTNYLNSLDYNHMIFLQSDVDEFMEKYRNKLDDQIKAGAVSTAFTIYNRYMERLEERNLLVQKLLKQPFDFTEDDEFIVVRNKEPWPKDDAEAAKLWRSRIKYELLQGKLAKEKPEETVGLISRRYHRLEKSMKDLDTEDVIQMYLTALARAYDPHSDYMSPSEAENFNIQHISLSLTGIGAQLVWEDGYTKIKELMPGGPAALSKQLRPGDKIVAVAQGDEEPVDVVEMPLNKVVNMIRGKKGTEVRLTIVPAKSPDTKRIISLIRNEIKITDALAKARVLEMSDPAGNVQKLGVITLPQFYDNCADHVEVLIQRLKKEKVQGIVLDLRRNGGGILQEAVQLTGLFIKEGPVVQVKEPSRRADILEDRDTDVAWDGPLAVAVSALSASASEIVAAALQDYGRALVIGDQSTHGKGTVQQVLSLDNIIVDRREVPKPGQLKLTVSKFYRIAGGTTQKHGVTPDIILPSLYDYLEIGEKHLENSLPADSTVPAKYTRQDLVKAFIPELQKNSQKRVQESQEFAYLLQDIEEVKKRREQKTVSLNEKARIEEKEQNKARLEARKKERASRTQPTDHIFELELEAAVKGLPLEPYSAAKKKQEADLALAEEPVTSEGEELDEMDLESEQAIDPQLNEALSILSEYIQLLNKEKSAVAASSLQTTP